MLTLACACGREYTLLPALAGLTVVCKSCLKPLPVPRADGSVPALPPPPPPPPAAPAVSRFTLSVPPPAPPPKPAPPAPKAEPVAPPTLQLELAGRGQRLLARIIDTVVIFAVVCLPPYLSISLIPGNALIVLLGSTVAAILMRVWLLSTRGQDVGKMAMGIVIVDEDGNQAGFMQAFLLRDGINIVVGLIPGIGTAYKLIDDVFIFSADQRCLHDRIAGTRVVKVPF